MTNVPPHSTDLPAADAIRDRALALRNLELIAARVPPGVLQALTPLLSEVPDPDGALNLFERLTAGAVPELFRLLDRERALVHYALIVFGYSQYLGETLIQNTDLFHQLGRERALDRSRSREELRETFARWKSRSFETDLAVLLARFKRREYVRIMLRDVLGVATLAETTAEISALADVLIEEAVTEIGSSLHARFGSPQHLDSDGRLADTTAAVLSLGKLGGNELNYSSDIDLFFLYGSGEEARTAPISSREYFIRLAQNVSEVLSRHTPLGSVFRVDLRLRPQGGEGEPAVDLGHALRYYADVAHDWELQAMIKARHSAGDLQLARRFLRSVQPYVYTPEINMAAIATALETRERIGSRRRAAEARGGTTIDVKLDRGGIRDIEFLVQCLQRVYGGKERWLRSGGTLFSLQKLHDKGHISGADFHQLTTAYEFLRRVEHRLQLRHGQQTHRLPSDPSGLAILARSVGAPPTGEGPSPDIAGELRRRMDAVAAIYQRIIHHQQEQIEQQQDEFRLQSTSELGREPSDRQILARLAAESPDISGIVSGARLSLQGRRNLFRFLAAAFTTGERYSAVVRSPRGLANALEIFEVSEFLTEILVRHPEEISTLEQVDPTPSADSGLLFADMPDRPTAPPWWAIAPDTTLQDKYAQLRRDFRRAIFVSAARDVVTHRPPRQSVAQTSAAADRAIAAACAIALGGPPLSRNNEDSGGPPSSQRSGATERQGGDTSHFAILALGRLGTREFDLLSDADLLFVRDPALSEWDAGRLAERVMEALSAYTREGTTFSVDARLRPRGGQGELVVTPAQLEDYFRGEAQAWEALTYAKLRLVAGSAELGRAACRARDLLLDRFAPDPQFFPAVREMRGRVEKQETGWNLKTSPGGLYDIDFLAGALAVRGRLRPLCADISTRLGQLHEQSLLSTPDFSLLERAAVLLLSLEHAIRLATGRARKELPSAEHARDASEKLAGWFAGRPFSHPQGIEVMAQVREVFDRLLA